MKSRPFHCRHCQPLLCALACPVSHAAASFSILACSTRHAAAPSSFLSPCNKLQLPFTRLPTLRPTSRYPLELLRHQLLLLARLLPACKGKLVALLQLRDCGLDLRHHKRVALPVQAGGPPPHPRAPWPTNMQARAWSVNVCVCVRRARVHVNVFVRQEKEV